MLRDFTLGLLCTAFLFLIANVVAIHVRSDAGLFEGLGLVDNWQDDIRGMGFPLLFYEEGGFAYRYFFSAANLFWDVSMAVTCAIGVGLGYAIRRRDARMVAPRR